MARPEKKKIPTSGDATVGSGLFQAFAGLSVDGLPTGPALTPEEKPAPSRKPGRVVLRKETAHRGGKTVIVIDGFEPHHQDADLEKLAKNLRGACGCGGSIKDRTIELQGDIAGKIREYLQKQGYTIAGVK